MNIYKDCTECIHRRNLNGLAICASPGNKESQMGEASIEESQMEEVSIEESFYQCEGFEEAQALE